MPTRIPTIHAIHPISRSNWYETNAQMPAPIAPPISPPINPFRLMLIPLLASHP
jgi:hypothetical protein